MKNKLKNFTTYAFFAMGCLANAQIGIGTTTPSSGFEVNTSMGLKVTTITSATTLDQTHNVVLCNTGPYTVTLPAAATNTGKIYYIKNIDAEGDNITIDGNGNETIEGKTGFLLDQQNLVIRIISDGSNWHVIEQSTPTNSFIANCDGSGFTWNDVVSTTGKTWMDRNLGASQVATATNDVDSYGDLYQWGRLKDGHQCRTSSTTATNSSDDTPGDALFITEESSPYDWRSSQNDNLWQGVDGTNNPCPGGYRLPTETEIDNEHLTWSSDDSDGAFGSVLKLPMSGYRLNSSGSLAYVTTRGAYWSSTVSGTRARYLLFGPSGASMGASLRAIGISVLCLKD